MTSDQEAINKMNDLENKLSEIKRVANNALYFKDDYDFIAALYDICEECGMKYEDIGNIFLS